MNKKKVIVFGVFDHLHLGHKYFLQQAKQLGDSLIVIVACDAMVKKVKKLTPSYSQKERVKMIKALKIADGVILGQPDLRKKYNIVFKLQPDIIALGYDQKIFVDQLPAVIQRMGKLVHIVRLKSFKTNLHKSSIYRQTKTI